MESHSPAIERLTQSLTTALPTLDVSTAKALAAAHLRRWPALASEPDLAVVPLGVFLWGFLGGEARPFVANGADALAVFDPEIEGIAAGLRRACLKEGVPAQYAALLIRAYEVMGLHAGEVHRHGLHEGSGTHRSGESHAVIAVAGSPDALAEAIELQRRSTEGDRAARVRMGEALGYPPCCIEVFLDDVHRGDNLANERRPFLRQPTHALAPLIHRLALPRLISHHLCSPDCQPSVESASKTMALMQAVDPSGAAWVQSELARPILFLDYARRARLAGQWTGEGPWTRFLVSRCEPIGDGKWMGIPPSEVTSISLMGHALVIEDRKVTASIVPASRPLLTTPGAPMASAALQAARGETGTGVVFSPR